MRSQPISIPAGVSASQLFATRNALLLQIRLSKTPMKRTRVEKELKQLMLPFEPVMSAKDLKRLLHWPRRLPLPEVDLPAS